MDDVIKLENQFMLCRFIYHAKLSIKVKLLYSGFVAFSFCLYLESIQLVINNSQLIIINF